MSWSFGRLKQDRFSGELREKVFHRLRDFILESAREILDRQRETCGSIGR